MSFPQRLYIGYYLTFAEIIDTDGSKRLVPGGNLAQASQRAAEYLASQHKQAKLNPAPQAQ